MRVDRCGWAEILLPVTLPPVRGRESKGSRDGGSVSSMNYNFGIVFCNNIFVMTNVMINVFNQVYT